MSPDATVPGSVVVAVQVHMVAVHVGDNVVLHVHKSASMGPAAVQPRPPLHNPPVSNHGGSAYN